MIVRVSFRSAYLLQSNLSLDRSAGFAWDYYLHPESEHTELPFTGRRPSPSQSKASLQEKKKKGWLALRQKSNSSCLELCHWGFFLPETSSLPGFYFFRHLVKRHHHRSQVLDLTQTITSSLALCVSGLPNAVWRLFNPLKSKNQLGGGGMLSKSVTIGSVSGLTPRPIASIHSQSKPQILFVVINSKLILNRKKKII